MSDINWFFRSPRSAPSPGEILSPLYLLRRDIDSCFGVDPNTGDILQPVDRLSGAALNCQAIWPGTMALLAGIDLLGKFLAGTDRTRGSGSVSVGRRYIDFCKRYLGLSATDTGLVYQLRNSLLHSFGLYSEVTDKHGNVITTYNFVLTRGSTSLVQHLRDDYFQIDVQILRVLFEQSVRKYQDDLMDISCADNTELNEKFCPCCLNMQNQYDIIINGSCLVQGLD